jgi:hypothetical protein
VQFHHTDRMRITERSAKVPCCGHQHSCSNKPAALPTQLPDKHNRQECIVQPVTADQQQPEHQVPPQLIAQPAIKMSQQTAVPY